MLKKLLSLSLAAVLLSTVAFASGGAEMIMDAAYAEVAEEVTDTIKVKNDDGTYNTEFLWVSQSTSEDGVVSQSVTGPLTWSDTEKTSVVGYSKSLVPRWTLAKIKVGKDWGTFSSLSLQMRVRALKATNVAYSMPISKADYDAAAAAATNGTKMSTLVQPQTNSDATYQLLADRAGKSNGSYLTYTLTLGAEDFTGNCYQDGYLYFAFQAISPDNGTYGNLGLDLHTSYWKFTVTGTKVAVTDFSDATITWTAATGAYTVTTATVSGTAMLVIASFNGTTMVDAKVATIDATTANAGVISGTIADLEAGTSYKAFLWAENTLVPAINAVEF